MDALADRLAGELARLERATLLRRRRVLDSAQGACVREAGSACANFSSNDYLGLANDPRLRAAAHAAIDAYGVGAGASPLVSGNLRAHEVAEERFARFVGLPRALLFGSGYAANLGILTSLAGPDGEIFSDRLNHACLIDGARLSRAKVTPYAHVDLGDLRAKLAASAAAVRIVASDAVFSMDGDVAPVPGLLALCEEFDAWLVLDDAHGIGVLGREGRGTLSHFALASPRIVYMATLGKALGGHGAFACGSEHVVDWLIQRARTYVYSTALPPMCAAVAVAAVDALEGSASPLPALRANVERFRAACARQEVAVEPSFTAIQPIVTGEPESTLRAAALLRQEGFLVGAIRPPTVPEGTSRLRISISAAHDPAEVESLAGALARAVR
jgi:8-amino-7-oxononanoate synthase